LSPTIDYPEFVLNNLLRIAASCVVAFLSIIAADKVFTFGTFSSSIFWITLLLSTVFSLAPLTNNSYLKTVFFLLLTLATYIYCRYLFHVDVIGDAEFYVYNALQDVEKGAPEYTPTILKSGLLSSYILAKFTFHGKFALQNYGPLFIALLMSGPLLISALLKRQIPPLLFVIPTTSIYIFLFNANYLELYSPAMLFSIFIVPSTLIASQSVKRIFLDIHNPGMISGILFGISIATHGVFFMYFPCLIAAIFLNADQVRSKVSQIAWLITGTVASIVAVFVVLGFTNFKIIDGNIQGGSDGSIFQTGYLSSPQTLHALSLMFLIFSPILVGILALKFEKKSSHIFLQRRRNVYLLASFIMCSLTFLLTYGFDLTLRTDIDLQLTAIFPFFAIALFQLRNGKFALNSYFVLLPIFLSASYINSHLLYISR
jgi:hypothetical protein